MGHSKETPRQKMINLMYLILTCLLALNVSKEVLQGFVIINDNIETTNSNFTGNTQLIMKAINDAIEQGHNEVIPYYQKAKEVTRMTETTFNYVDSLKKEVIKYTEDKDGADTLKLGEVDKLDDYDKPTYFLIGSDETKPKTGKYSAIELKQMITTLTDSLGKMIDYMKDKDGLRLPEDDYQVLKGKIKLFTPHDNYTDEEGNPLSWEMKNFYNLPLAAVVTNLSKIQSDIRNIEGELVGTFASAAGKLSVKFNRMEARIVPVSKYVQSGTPYLADVFLSASSSQFTRDNLEFILGDVDTATGKMSESAVVLPVENGTGKVKFPTGTVGHQQIKGWVRFRNGTGKYEYYSYNNEYIVANTAVAVSPDKMNVFYSGVENPLTVSAAGVAPTDLVVNIAGSNGNLINKGNGKYVANVKGAGTCTVTVFRRNEQGGIERQGEPQVFRVKKVPSPPVKINGRPVIGNLDMRASEAKTIRSLDLDLTNFEFGAPFRIKEFSIVAGGPGMTLQFYKCSGNKLSEGAIEGLKKVKPGCKIYFEDIKVEAPDETREFPMVKVSVK
jgi:gliding motility-associated protein GldM